MAHVPSTFCLSLSCLCIPLFAHGWLQALALEGALPEHCQDYAWRLLYSLSGNGDSWDGVMMMVVDWLGVGGSGWMMMMMVVVIGWGGGSDMLLVGRRVCPRSVVLPQPPLTPHHTSLACLPAWQQSNERTNEPTNQPTNPHRGRGVADDVFPQGQEAGADAAGGQGHVGPRLWRIRLQGLGRQGRGVCVCGGGLGCVCVGGVWVDGGLSRQGRGALSALLLSG
jgi:hypothetical protein